MKGVHLTILMIVAASIAFSQPPVAKKKFYIFLLAGQSNMAGRGTVEAVDKQASSKIWMFSKTGEWLPATEPLHFDKPGIVGVGPGLAFARRMLQLDTSLVIGLIPCALGGTSINLWQPSAFDTITKTHPYDDAISRTKKAMQSGTLKGILWHQGESDCDSVHAIGYSKKLVDLVQRFRKDLGAQKLPFIAGELGTFYSDKHPVTATINEAIKGLRKKVKKVAVVSSAGLTHKGDGTHFDSQSAREFGGRYADIFYNLFGTK